jgi:RsiW-degrading membrane proteinase PrsW (M82 family)
VLFIVRVIMFGWGHVLYTGTTGAGLGLAAETSNPTVRRIAPVAGYLFAILLHLLWNTTQGIMGGIRAAPVVQLFGEFSARVRTAPVHCEAADMNVLANVTRPPRAGGVAGGRDSGRIT